MEKDEWRSPAPDHNQCLPVQWDRDLTQSVEHWRLEHMPDREAQFFAALSPASLVRGE